MSRKTTHTVAAIALLVACTTVSAEEDTTNVRSLLESLSVEDPVGIGTEAITPASPGGATAREIFATAFGDAVAAGKGLNPDDALDELRQRIEALAAEIRSSLAEVRATAAPDPPDEPPRPPEPLRTVPEVMAFRDDPVERNELEPPAPAELAPQPTPTESPDAEDTQSLEQRLLAAEQRLARIERALASAWVLLAAPAD